MAIDNFNLPDAIEQIRRRELENLEALSDLNASAQICEDIQQIRDASAEIIELTEKIREKVQEENV